MQKDYDRIILLRIEKSFDRLLPLGALLAYTIAFLIYFNKAHLQFVTYDVILGTCLLGIYAFRSKINVEMKIIIVLGITFVLGILALLFRGFIGVGIMILVITNLIATTFLRLKLSFIYSACSIGAVMCIWFLSSSTFAAKHMPLIYLNTNHLDWFIKSMMFSLFIIVLNIIAKANKSYLVSNIEEIERGMETTYNLAYFDQLTSAPNRYMFIETLQKRYETGHSSGYIVLFDMKSFKLINSIHGNETGDDLLIKVARTLMELKGSNELVARISGNEFAWWMEGLGKHTIDYRIDYLQEEVLKRLRMDGVERNVEFYISYAHLPTNGSTIEQCYGKAIIALQHAKVNNSHLPVAYSQMIEKQTRDEAFMRDCLIEGLEKDEFYLLYQEKVDSRTGLVMGVEALARWESTKIGCVTPSVFIPAVEAANLSVKFGNMIIEKALDHYNLLVDKYNDDIELSINISPSHMGYKGFKLLVMDEISKRGIDPSKIILEITEEIIIEGTDIISQVINPLREFGVKIALDDFGSGYSSMNYLTVLEIDELKIDKSFIDKMCGNVQVQTILKAVVQIADAYGFRMIVEGVETKEQVEMLAEMACYNIQGYYYSKPGHIHKGD